MMKVRWSCFCAGGCGEWLTVGTLAGKHHRNLWCLGCSADHQEVCGVCREREAVRARRGPAADAMMLF